MALTISLTNKVALVTGGGRGIGRDIARCLAEAGAQVVIASRKQEQLDATAAELRDLPGRVIPIACHVGREDQLTGLCDRVEAEVGPIDVLVNNAATNIGQGPSLETDTSMLDKMVDVNIKSAFRLVHRVVPGMIERGGGSVLNIVSISGLKPQAGGLLYSFTKAGLIMLTRSWAREFGPHGVRVNAIAPGLIQTDFSAYYWKDESRKTELVGDQPLPRLGQPQDVGPAAAFLCSDLAAFITGQVLVIDGGALA
ncbi:SDR family NAD(P)-dependent oxidoreductase [Paraliomyxa miuraensis]|uniref:SDR family NAD(P)-dependent oxidoreductase n=1 Tax=Paraliomyxa miuraensis TaxID=376150 RepID=UPI002256EF01|nr:SDR family oxidoreductase [Paraliomyxa miuraensis]MCX4241948.1 SDR family oxidoreductase [Paraliomyxa miuraensis]